MFYIKTIYDKFIKNCLKTTSSSFTSISNSILQNFIHIDRLLNLLNTIHKYKTYFQHLITKSSDNMSSVLHVVS